MNVGDKMVAVHRALASAEIPHAFGGALALAWCTEMARGTVDVDVNVFVRPEGATDVLRALPDAIAWGDGDLDFIHRDGQVRLRWDATPVDLFFSTTELHEEAAARTRWEPYEGKELPFLDCTDLAAFKVFFNRTRDWADLEDMKAAGTLDVDSVVAVLTRFLRPDDERIEKLLEFR